MAEKRVQVERLRPSARLQAVARPVETYVRQQSQYQESELSQFVKAVSPAMQTLAEVERQEQLKLQREAEKGIASKRAFQAKLSTGKALREALNDYVENEEDYYQLSTEEVTARREEIFAPYIDAAMTSGDADLITAIQQDLQLGNLDFFGRYYDKGKYEYTITNEMTDLFNEIGYIDRNFSMPNELKDQAIDELINGYQATSGTNWNDINGFAFGLAANQVGTEGRNGIYRWLDRSKQLNNTRFSETKRQLDSRLATYDSKFVSAQKDAFFSQQMQTSLVNFLNTGDVQGWASEVTFQDGSTRSVTDEDRITAYEMYANQNKIPVEEQVAEFWKPMDILPTQASNAIASGKFVFKQGSEITEDNVQKAMNAYEAYKFATENQLPLKSNLMDDDTKRLFHVVDYLIEKKGIGGAGATPQERMDEALRMVHGINPKASTKKATLKDIEAGLDTGIFDVTDLDEVTNKGLIATYVQDGVNVYMQLDGVGLEEALGAALADAKKDFITIEASNGTTQAISLLNTDISRSGGEAVKLQRYLNEWSSSKEAKLAMETAGATGLTLKSSRNRNELSVVMIDDSGRVIGNFMTVPLKVAADPATLRSMINERQRRQAEEDAFMTGQLGVVEAPIQTALTEDIVPTTPEGTPDLLNAPITMENMGVVPIQPILPESFRISTAQPIMDGTEFTGRYLYTGTLPDGSTARYQSSTTPIKAGLSQPAYEDVIISQVTEEQPQEAGEPTYDEVGLEVQRTVQQAIEDTFDVASYSEISNMMGNQAEDTLNRILKNKAIQDMEGTEEEKKSVITTVMDFLFNTSAEASGSDIAGDVENITGTTPVDKATNLIISQEGFKNTPYKDGKDRSVGYGFYLPSLEPDEKALIKDVENITKEEADAVMQLKVQKIDKFWNKEVGNFNTFSDEQQAALMSMAYQLGATNIPKDWPKFLTALKKAANAPVGSAERQTALEEASFNMLFNRRANGSKSQTNWHKQTPKRAKAMAAVISG